MIGIPGIPGSDPGDPAYAATRERLSGELDQFLQRVGDGSHEPEEDMRRRILDPAGEPRVTPPPEFDVRGDGIHISAEYGASIGYRIDQGPWELYSKPIPIVDGSIEAKSVRYGWTESSVRTLNLDQ